MLQLNYQQDGVDVGCLSLKQSIWLSKLKSRPALVTITPNSNSDSDPIASYITDVYRKSYNATMAVQYPKLACLKDRDGGLLAAVGFRPATDNPLFLEQYLETPIEKLLRIPRAQIVEIGNLASHSGGTSIFLFAALAAYLHHLGFNKAVVTATQFLEQRFKYLGLSPQRLAMADPNLLLQKGEDWGIYYDTRPYVLAGSVAKSYQRLQKFLHAEYQESTPLTVIDGHQ